MSKQQSYLEFATFEPGPKSKSLKYEDYPGACVLHYPQNESFKAQGADSGPKVRPLNLVFDMGEADANEFRKACSNNMTQAVKSVEIASTIMIQGKRVVKKKVKYEYLTVTDVEVESVSGEQDALVTCVAEYLVGDGKVFDYDKTGKIIKSSDINVDLRKGDFK